ncbi:hypothetical protein GIB67_001430, partial [Kingdonia uniflora]
MQLNEIHGNISSGDTLSVFSWRRYGFILEKFQKRDESLVRRIKGCVVDSAPVAAPDLRVKLL